jgi:hypothetical protein
MTDIIDRLKEGRRHAEIEAIAEIRKLRDEVSYNKALLAWKEEEIANLRHLLYGKKTWLERLFR